MLIFAVVLRLAADLIFLTGTVNSGLHPPPLDVSGRWGARVLDHLGGRFADIAQALAYVGLIIWVEVLHRWSVSLKDVRLQRQSALSDGAS